jgi:hypothetical protein
MFNNKFVLIGAGILLLAAYYSVDFEGPNIGYGALGLFVVWPLSLLLIIKGLRKFRR